MINAFFHAHSGGKTENISNIWGQEDIPYLRSVEGLENELDIDEVKISYIDLEKMIREKYLFSGDFNDEINENEIRILERNSSGRVSKLQILDIILSGTEARTLFNLRSTNFEIYFCEDGLIFKTNGYGHGVGLSQQGANSMAKQGKKYREIISHYYTDVEIKLFQEI